MSKNTLTGLDLILNAAQAHGENSEPEHEVGDLQVVLRAAWRVMTPGQRVALLRDADVAEQLENELPATDDGASADDQVEAAVRAELEGASHGGTVFDRLVNQFPGLALETDVHQEVCNSRQVLDWLSENLGLLKSAQIPSDSDPDDGDEVTFASEDTSKFFELILTMRSNTTAGEEDITIRVWHGQKAAQVAADVAKSYGATVSSLMHPNGTPFKSVERCERCDSEMEGEYCTDQTCVYSNWPQSVPRDDIISLPTAEIETKFSLKIRSRLID